MTTAGEQLQAYSSCLYRPGDWVETRCIQRTPRRIERDWFPAEHLADQADRLVALNAQGFDVYAGANRRIASGSTTDAGVDLCRTVFVDFDHLSDEPGASYDDIACARIAAAGLPLPTLRIFTGHGVHAYWRLASPIRPGEWSEVQNRLIVTLDSDPAIKNPERIMRLPGFANVKDPDHPVDCFVLDADPSRIADLPDLLAHCRAAAQVVPVARVDEPGRTQERPAFTDPERRAVAYAAKWPHCTEGDRNDTAYLHACQLVNDLSIPQGLALDLLRSWNAGNQPPLPDAEIISVVHSAHAYHRFTPGAKLNRAKCQPDRTEKRSRRSSRHETAENVVPRPIYTCIADVEAKPVKWLWQYRIARAMLSLLIGIEGLGKTFVGLDIAAAVTRGRPWPDSEGAADTPEPANVIILTSEDHLSYTIRPRFDRLGGDPARLFALQGVTLPTGSAFFDIVHHLPAIKTMIEEIGNVALVLVDPLTAYLGAVDQHNNGEVRVALAQFSSLAEQYGCAILGISHLSKDASKQAIHRTIGSVAFSAAARAVWLVGKDRDDPSKRLFLPVKMNVAKPAKGLRFGISDGRIEWDAGQFDYDADAVLSVDPQEDAVVLSDACEWLSGLLSNGRVLSGEVQKLAKREQISLSTLRRAKAKLGVQAVHEGMGTGSVWFWTLPNGGTP